MVEQHVGPTITSPGIKSVDESDLSSASDQANLNMFGRTDGSDNDEPSSPDVNDNGLSSHVFDHKAFQRLLGGFPFPINMNNAFLAAAMQPRLPNFNGGFGMATSNPSSSRQTPDRTEEDEDLENMNGTEPEDLSLGRVGGKDKKGSDFDDSGSVQNSNYTFEEQFKQLYEVNDDPNRKAWLDDWFSFMNKIGKPVTRIPIMAKQVLDLYELYHLVVKHGGLVEIINKKLWREITKGLNLPPSITSAAFTLRTQYQKYLYDYECEKMNLSTSTDLNAAIEANKREGRRNPGSMMGPSSSNGLGNPLMMNGGLTPGSSPFSNWTGLFGKFHPPFGFKTDEENPLANLANNQLAAAAAANFESQKQFELFQRATAEASRQLVQTQNNRSGRSSASSVESNKNNSTTKRSHPDSFAGPSAKKICPTSSTNMKLVTKDNQMFVSMELNGSVYQGVLFSVDATKSDNSDFADSMHALSALLGGDLPSNE